MLPLMTKRESARIASIYHCRHFRQNAAIYQRTSGLRIIHNYEQLTNTKHHFCHHHHHHHHHHPQPVQPSPYHCGSSTTSTTSTTTATTTASAIGRACPSSPPVRPTIDRTPFQSSGSSTIVTLQSTVVLHWATQMTHTK